MPWPFLAGVIKLVVTFGFDGNPSVNVHFVLQRTPESPIPAATLRLAANGLRNALADEWAAVMGDQWTVDNVTATDWSLADGEQVATNGALPVVGTEVNEEVPASVCIVASHRSERTGRSRRGRTYLPGLTEANVGGNGVDAGLITAVGDFFDAFESSMDGNDMDHIVYSLFSGGAERVTPVTTIITSRIVNSRVDTQRRRLPN